MQPLPPTSGSPAFDRLRDEFSAELALRRETENALQLLVDRLSPTDRGARFVVGAAVEWIVAAAAWSAGVLTVPGGHGVDGFDLKDLERSAKGLWSVKSSFQKSPSAFRISNGLGGAGKGLEDPTVFLSPRLPGMVLVHPALHTTTTDRVVNSTDSMQLPFAAVREHSASHPECVIEMVIPVNQHRGTEDPALVFTKDLLNLHQFPRLSRVFAEAERTAQTIADDLQTLVALLNTGQLTQDEFSAAKARLLKS